MKIKNKFFIEKTFYYTEMSDSVLTATIPPQTSSGTLTDVLININIVSIINNSGIPAFTSSMQTSVTTIQLGFPYLLSLNVTLPLVSTSSSSSTVSILLNNRTIGTLTPMNNSIQNLVFSVLDASGFLSLSFFAGVFGGGQINGNGSLQIIATPTSPPLGAPSPIFSLLDAILAILRSQNHCERKRFRRLLCCELKCKCTKKKRKH